MTAPDENHEPEPGRDRSPVIVICSTVLALAVLGLFAWQQATGKETGTTLVLLAGILGAGGFGVASYQRAGQMQRDVSAVRTQTNGNTSRLLDIIDAQSRQLAQSTPVDTERRHSSGVDAPPVVQAEAPVPPTP